MRVIRLLAERKKYEILLVSFLILVFGNTFCCGGEEIADKLLLLQNMIVGFFIFYPSRRLRWFIGSLTLLIIALEVLSYRVYYIGHSDVESLTGVVYLFYFGLIAWEVYRKLFCAQEISTEMISVVLCGFLLLCLIGTFLFYQIEVLSPHSFAHVGTGKRRLIDLNYFGFVTVLTIGYGDIVPLSTVAKRAVMFIGLAGHFYTVFVTGIIIGKYINSYRVSMGKQVRG
jgi:voltage-gated potassium channel